MVKKQPAYERFFEKKEYICNVFSTYLIRMAVNYSINNKKQMRKI